MEVSSHLPIADLCYLIMHSSSGDAFVPYIYLIHIRDLTSLHRTL